MTLCVDCVIQTCDASHSKDEQPYWGWCMSLTEAEVHFLMLVLALFPFFVRQENLVVDLIRDKLCPTRVATRKAVVMSCPEYGSTLDAPPYDQNVMEKVQELSRKKLVKMGINGVSASDCTFLLSGAGTAASAAAAV